MGAVAQFERDLIAERVRPGIAHARAMGKHIGRPRAPIDVRQVGVLRRQGQSLRQIARIVDVPVSRVRRALLSGREQPASLSVD
jgi:DNA invertase Pin-like site-specific DNA recombinase